MKVDPTRKLADQEAEQTIIACLLKDANNCFFDIDALIKDIDFFYPQNQIIYSTTRNLILTENIKQPDIHTISNAIQKLDSHTANKYSIPEYLSILSAHPALPENAMPFVKTVKKLALRRQLKDRLLESIVSLETMDDSVDLTTIISTAEKPIIEFSNNAVGNDVTENLGVFSWEYLRILANNPPTHLGIPTGFPRYDEAVGNGLRPGVHIVAGRAKSRKSMFGIQICDNVTKNNTKVLYLDTELSKETLASRWLGMVTGVPIDVIEKGNFINTEYADIIRNSVKDIRNRPFSYHNIASKTHYEWISIMRRWLFREVGFNKDGQLNPCLIVLDYIKMMDLRHAQAFAEHQYLGQIITDLHNFCLQYKVPIFALCQLNREGILREDQGVLAGSDKLIGLCSSAFIIKAKTPEDLVEDSEANGDRKLVALAQRFGKELSMGTYINVQCDPLNGRMIEGKYNYEVKSKNENVDLRKNKYESKNREEHIDGISL